MIQIIVCVGLFGVGAYLIKRALEGYPRDEGAGYLGVFLVAVMGTASSVLLGGVVSEHVGADAQIVRYEELRMAVRAARRGDPSYSGVFKSVLEFNKDLAVYKLRNPSIWWDVFYSDKLAALEQIEYPQE